MIDYDSFSRCHLTDIFFDFYAGAKELILITCHLFGTSDKSTKFGFLKRKTFEIHRDSARSRLKFYPIIIVLHYATLLGPKKRVDSTLSKF